MSAKKKNVLVLCARNSARSQMAEAFLRRFAGDQFEVFSAGLEEAEIHPLTHRVMAEAGFPLTGHRSKAAREFLGKLHVHHLIVVCERTEQECPKLFPGASALHSWPFSDPVRVEGPPDVRLAAFRDVRDAIKWRVLAWLDEPRASGEPL